MKILINYNKEAIIELLKSIGRFVWFGFLGLVVSMLTMIATSGAVNDIIISINGFNVDLSSAIVLVTGFLIKALDKYIHENKNINSNGLAPEFLQPQSKNSNN